MQTTPDSGSSSATVPTNAPVTYKSLYEGERQKNLLLTVVALVLGVMFVISSTMAIVAHSTGPGFMDVRRFDERINPIGPNGPNSGLQGRVQSGGRIPGQNNSGQITPAANQPAGPSGANGGTPLSPLK